MSTDVEPRPERLSEQDGDLVARSLREPDAFLSLFELHFDAVHRYLHRRAGRELADELSAETFVRAFESRARFVDRGAGALPWLYGIATNLLRGYHRTEVRRLRAYAQSSRDDESGLDVDELAERVDAGSLAGVLAEGLASLSSDERDAICLVAFAELTHEQAADALGVPPGTIASRVHRARAGLRAALANHDARDLEMT